MTAASLYRLTAFSDTAKGGNPAGVWVGEQLPAPAAMQTIAAEVGFSETAFLAPGHVGEWQIRYFSPQAEVSFCGHATIAAAAVLGQLSGAGNYRLSSAVGEVEVRASLDQDRWRASFRTVTPRQRPLPDSLLVAALTCLRWRSEELDPGIPPMLAYAGAWHLVLAAASAERLARLEYDFEGLRELMLTHDLTTLQLVHRREALNFAARNPFPVGGVVEDAATGAAAAALAGYLRDAGLIAAPARLQIEQGAEIGRPSLINVSVPEHGGIEVGGLTAWLNAEPGREVGHG